MNSGLTTENKQFKDIAVGISYSTKIFGLGGLHKDALLFDARQNLIQNRPLAKNESYVNITVDIKKTYFCLFHRTKVTMIADVVQPRDTNDTLVYTKNYLDKSYLFNPKSQSPFKPFDSLFHSNFYIGKVIGLTGRNFKRVRYLKVLKNGAFRTKTILAKKVYIKLPKYRGIRLGQLSPRSSVLGFSQNHVFIRTDSTLSRVPYQVKL